jgi:hypothetical protein
MSPAAAALFLVRLALLQVFVSDANSTAYQYPMVDAKVFRDSSGAVAAEVPLVSVQDTQL